jgi:hypothetical protein
MCSWVDTGGIRSLLQQHAKSQNGTKMAACSRLAKPVLCCLLARLARGRGPLLLSRLALGSEEVGRELKLRLWFA